MSKVVNFRTASEAPRHKRKEARLDALRDSLRAARESGPKKPSGSAGTKRPTPPGKRK